jgi:hypothetical protein
VDRIEGAIVFDGLLEGKSPAGDFERTARDWMQSLEAFGVRFNLEASGRAFSLLPYSEPVSAGAFGDSPEDDFRELLDRLVRAIGPFAHGQIFSTLRSVRFRPKKDVRALYFVAADGSVRVRVETVAVETPHTPRPLAARRRSATILFGLALGAMALGLTAWIIDLGRRPGGFLHPHAALPIEAVVVDLQPLERFLLLAGRRETENGRGVVLTLQRTDDYPRDDASAALAIREAGTSVSQRLAVEALVRGYVRCELFDGDGNFLRSAEYRVAPLRDRERIDLIVSDDGGVPVARIAIAF